MRLFIAARIGELEASRIHRGLAQVKSRGPRASWVSPNAYHLTYAFVGEQAEDVAERIAGALQSSVAAMPLYEGALSGGGFFPNERRPRVGWLGLERPGNLISVADSVRGMLDRLGVSYDAKAFRPHLTVVRIRDRWSGSDLTEFVRACDALGRIEVVIDRVSLFRSELRPDGARHYELASATLSL